MTPSEIAKILSPLQHAFPYHKLPEATVVLYCQQLGGYKKGELETAVQDLLHTSTRFPSIADICRSIRERRVAENEASPSFWSPRSCKPSDDALTPEEWAKLLPDKVKIKLRDARPKTEAGIWAKEMADKINTPPKHSGPPQDDFEIRAALTRLRKSQGLSDDHGIKTEADA